MGFKKHGTILLNGFVVAAPAIITVYVVGAALWGLDKLVRSGLAAVWVGPLKQISAEPVPGIGIVVGLVAIYAVGLATRMWVFQALIGLGERLVERIPLVKSLYSAVRDMLQFLGGAKAEQRGKPAIVRSPDGRVALLGLITRENASDLLPEREDCVAVYLPMSYQLGGYTLFLPRSMVEEAEHLTVEDLLKLTLTAGVGSAKKPQDTPEGGKDEGDTLG